MSTGTPDESHGANRVDGVNGDSEFSIARSNALIPLLVLFGATVALVLVVIVRARPVVSAHGAVANKAFGPADFPLVFGKEELLPAPAAHPSADGAPAFPLPAPPFSEGIFPCSNCHAGMETNPDRRVLEAMHGDIVLRHDEEHRWCLDCHDANDRDQLRLASGSLVPFTESYRLCGQCHGTQFRDWRTGIHGKRVGYWNGAKRYLLCVHCHNPHSPRFAPLAPLPPPVRPQFLRAQDAAAAGVARAQEEPHDGGHAR